MTRIPILPGKCRCRMSRSRIIIEDKIPAIKGVFDAAADVEYLPVSEITREVLQSADAVITRTRPYLGENLLAGSKLRIIATATIGTDHIDAEYCRRNNIKVVNAPGCNAPAVAQWVMTSIFSMTDGKKPESLTVGIVGVGHVGKIVSLWSRQAGFTVLENDPPREQAEGSGKFADINEIAAKADIITFHTPLTKTGKFPTFHLADEKFFKSLKRRPIIINAARGAVIETPALIQALKEGRVSAAAIDCWEGEPEISYELLKMAEIATPHIAGYSREGKLRATEAVIKAVADELNLEVQVPFSVPVFDPERAIPRELLQESYNPLTDTQNLKNNPGDFEKLRDNYILRSEP